MTIGQRIKKRRETMKLTQQQLAEALGVTAQHVSAIEKDKRAPSLDSLVRLAEELGVTIDFLVTSKEGVITDPIPAIRADKKLKIEIKRALITLIQTLYSESDKS